MSEEFIYNFHIILIPRTRILSAKGMTKEKTRL